MLISAPGLRHDALDGLAARADDQADLVRVDLDRLDARRVLAHLLARAGDGAVHHCEHLIALFPGVADGGGHEFVGDAGQLEIKLEAGDALRRAAELEIHVAVVILTADNVGEEGVALHGLAIFLELGDEADRDARHRALERHARVETSSARLHRRWPSRWSRWTP